MLSLCEHESGKRIGLSKSPSRALPRLFAPARLIHRRNAFAVLLLCASLVLATSQTPARTELPTELPKNFSSVVATAQAEMMAEQIPGAAIAIVSGDKVVFVKGFGVASQETGAAVTPEMLFRIASITKMFTSTALVTLAEQKQLSLNAPLGSYLQAVNPRLAQLTMHQLLTHTAGLVEDLTLNGSHDETNLAAAVQGWGDNVFFESPGKTYSYSSPGFVLSGWAVQELSGKPYAEEMSTLLFNPLGMSRTTFRPTEAMTYPLALGHEVVATQSGEKLRVVRPMIDDAARWPAGYMFSNVNDLSRFAIAFMNDGKLEGRQVLSPEVIRKVSTPYVDTHSASTLWQQGYGMRVGIYRGVRVVEHLGGTSGYGALLRMVPEQKFAVIILTNKSLGQMEKTADKAMEVILPLLSKSAAKQNADLSLSKDDLSFYPGTYANGKLKFELRVKGNKLYLVESEETIPLKKVSKNVLSVDFKRVKCTEDLKDLDLFQNLVFVRNSSGRAEYMYFLGRALKREDSQSQAALPARRAAPPVN
jgi:CubicO group peptidase (beta-lactamase class C family)